MTVSVCITAIPNRKDKLARALSSVLKQVYPVDQIVVSVDYERLGAAGNRNKAWRAATSEWVCFLDDDDEMDPDHVETLVAHQQKTGADLVFPWHRVNRLGDIIPSPLKWRGCPDDQIIPTLEASGNFIAITNMVRRSALEAVGGFPAPYAEDWPYAECEDWGCWMRLARAGFTFSHIDKETWTWHHHGQNTSGRSDRW